MYSFRMSFCRVPESLRPIDSLLLGHRQIHGPRTAAGELMVIETVTSSSGMPSKRISISSSERGGAALADFAFGHGVIGVIAHQGGQIEGDGEPGLALCRAGSDSARLVSSGVAKPENWRMVQSLPAIHVAMDAARVGKLAGLGQIAIYIEITQRLRSIQRLYGHSAERSKPGLNI